MAWYPDAVPGSHHGSWAARSDVAFSQSYRSSRFMGSVHPGRPAVCDIRWRTSTPSLPAAANSGQYLATGACTSSSPRSTRTRAQRAVIVLVVDQTLVMVSRSHGADPLVSTVPAQMSTTGSPSTTTAADAPT